MTGWSAYRQSVPADGRASRGRGAIQALYTAAAWVPLGVMEGRVPSRPRGVAGMPVVSRWNSTLPGSAHLIPERSGLNHADPQQVNAAAVGIQDAYPEAVQLDYLVAFGQVTEGVHYQAAEGVELLVGELG